MRARGVNLEQMMDRLRLLDLRPVFTAHPTEAAPIATLHARQRVTEHLSALDAAGADSPDSAIILEALSDDVKALWHASPVRLTKPSVSDEIVTTLAYFDSRHCSTPSRGCIASWHGISRQPTRRRSRRAICPRWCASARGSAATATAIPTSLPRRCAKRSIAAALW